MWATALACTVWQIVMTPIGKSPRILVVRNSHPAANCNCTGFGWFCLADDPYSRRDTLFASKKS